ncbi:AMP-binding protein [bacterium]|nr:AMP-binding protein [bacterium]
MVLRDFLSFDRHSKRVAVIEQSPFRARKYTYAEMEQGLSNVAASFQEHALQEGDKVILWGDNSARWMMTFYACLLLKIVVVPIDASFSRDYVEKIRKITNAKLVCSDEEGSDWNAWLKEAGKSPAWPASDPHKDTLLEIIFTSGTTGEPKGVMITHGNLLANLVPIHEEYQKYKKFAAPFSPLRFVHLIPLSHLFGQVMGLFIPQMLAGTLVFTSAAASQIVQTAKTHRVSVIVCVPQELSLLRKYVAKKYEVKPMSSEKKRSPVVTILTRWWKYRKVHQEFGWKFWAFVVGGATLPMEEEKFWSELGYAVIQGYGLTETAPSITITHPFKGIKPGFVGKKLPGLEVRIAEDGEILVRGPHVSPGYFHNESATQEVYRDGWLHTGDLGQFDSEGNLQLLGRKKEVIVTSEGLNVYPQDVEDVLNEDPRVAESAVVSKEIGSRSVVHAVFILKDNAAPDAIEEIVSQANARLEGFQRIQSFSLWPDSELPRTSTGKLKRLAIASGIVSSSRQQESPEDLVRQLLSGVAGEKRLDQDLGLSSLDRVELLMELESSGNTEIDEVAFASAKTLRDVSALIEKSSAGETLTLLRSYPYWRWTRWFPIRLVRYLSWYTLVFPVMPLRMTVQVTGLENLTGLKPPLFFVSNHQSILDAPAILKALPSFRWRTSLAPAMGFRKAWIDLYAAGLFFNIYPLPPTSVGLRKAIELTGELVDKGYSPLVFPEGERTPDGRLRPFRHGIGVLVNYSKLPVVPVFLCGAYEIWPIHSRGPKKKGIIRIHFGKPVDFSGKTPAEITTELEALYKQSSAGVPPANSADETSAQL